jgi:SNF2 family DNA or RNA helicase
LIIADTIEEKIVELQLKKRELSETAMGSQKHQSKSNLSRSELFDLLGFENQND